MTTKTLPVLSFAKLDQGMPMPHLLDIQTRAFASLLQPDGKGAERTDVGLERVFKDVFPIQDVNGNYSLEFVKYALGEPKYSVEECIERDMTYSVPLKATLQLVVMEEVGETTKTKRPKNIIEKEVYLGELPILTPLGTFVINGAERVIVSQLHRSPGVVFEESIHPNGQRLFSARIIPFRGSWVEFTIDIHDVIYVHIDKKKKFPATALLRAFGHGANADIQKLFFNPKRYDLGRVGRYKINQRLKLRIDPNHTVLTEEDFVAIIRYLIDLHDGRGFTDDIDHLGNRRIRSVGELIANQFSVGLSRMARLVKERMSITTDVDKMNIDDLVNARTVSAVIQAFFGSSQLSQFMDQTNPLAELTHKRRLSALGPGGLTRERAGFEVRDVHYSQYGRMCPIETPEGPNIGLIGSLSTYARVNSLGFIETPYRKVENGKVTGDVDWLDANKEEEVTIAQANARLKEDGSFAEELVLSRQRGDVPLLPPDRIDYMDVAPEQLVS